MINRLLSLVPAADFGQGPGTVRFGRHAMAFRLSCPAGRHLITTSCQLNFASRINGASPCRPTSPSARPRLLNRADQLFGCCQPPARRDEIDVHIEPSAREVSSDRRLRSVVKRLSHENAARRLGAVGSWPDIKY